jgi:hypothetical protein
VLIEAIGGGDSRLVEVPGLANWLIIGSMAKPKIPETVGQAAIAEYLAGGDPAQATRYLLQRIEQAYPGGAVELRVPPYGAVQCLAGQEHRRGTPPNVVEMMATDFLELCLGKKSWNALHLEGKLSASGTLAANLQEVFPITEV